MSYVVLNGVKSTTVNGLLIQSLPPITKPKMRTSIETIDGRDGDIVTKLGYSAYDREITIGLYGDYNVDDVIRYFDSAGDAIFSNEPDKYYRYQIIEQIDFERLIRFRTAKVKMHVQPFKYSTIDDSISISNDEMSLRPYSESNNGVYLNVENGKITLKGTATIATEIYMPINAMELDAGNYTLQALTTGTGASACSIRVIGMAPSNVDSFGGTYLTLQDTGTATMDETITAPKTYKYIWFHINAGTELNYTLTVKMINESLKSIKVFNMGNTVSKPEITIFGSGTVGISLNGVKILSMNIDDSYITIDSEKMDAYHDGILKNRQITGDYANLAMNVGSNVISWVGNVDKVEIKNVSRWI